MIYPDPVFDTELNSMERSYQSKTDNYLTINVSLTNTRLVSEMAKGSDSTFTGSKKYFVLCFL